MKIVIEKVNLYDNPNIIYFSTEFGNAQAIWEGDKPEIGKEYFVEVDIENPLKFEDDLIEFEQDTFSIGMVKDSIFIIGFLESVEDDGYSVLRLRDNIVTFEVEGRLPSDNIFIRIEPRKIKLFQVKY